MVTKLGASVSKPYFMHNNNRIIVFYDPPHVLMNIHKTLKRSGFKVGENNVLWQQIVLFYSSDSVLPIRMALKLTQKTCGFVSVFREGERGDTEVTLVLHNSILPSDRTWSYFVH